MRSASRTRRRSAGAAAAAGLTALALLVGCTSEADPQPQAPATSAPPSAPASVEPSQSPSASTSPTASPSAALDAAARATLQPFYDQDLDWSGCGAAECATLRVPRRYAEPSLGDAIRLPLLRLRATGDRLGSLVVNPGGPGGSGVRYARAGRQVLGADVVARYDVVGFDPRGVQGSVPAIDCVSDAQLDQYIGGATTLANAKAQLADSRAFARGCAKRSADLFAEVGTRDAARDLDLLRSALGERQLDFLGKSYGTLLGITYAEAFPKRVGRFVLDGVLDPSLDPDGVLRGQTKGFEVAYRAFLKSCVNGGGCPLGSSVRAAYARTVSWLDELEAKPLGPAGTRRLTQPLASLALLGSVYEDRSQWSALEAAFRDAFAGSPRAMLRIADDTADRSPDGTYPTNSNEAQYAITCLDRTYDATVADIAARADRLAKVSPIFGEYLAWGDLPCTQWKAEPTREAHRVAVAEIPPMLLLGTTRDPATPYEWSTSLQWQLGDAALVTWKSDGHTAYRRGSACVDAAVDTFLVRGRLPAEDPVCVGR